MKSFHGVPGCVGALIIGAVIVGCGGGAELAVPGGGNEAGIGGGPGTGAGGTTGVINLGDSGIVDPFAPECDGGACAEAAPKVPPVCGDSKINQADEKCDDGNTVSGDGCTANCLQIED